MGRSMERPIVEAGPQLPVASRSPGPGEEAVAFGAHDGRDPLGVVEASETTILCLPNSPDVVDVLDEVLPALGPGKIVVDTSTIDPDVERGQHLRIEAAGARYLEAPLSGAAAGAQKGQPTLLAG